VLRRSKSSLSLWPLIISVKMKLSSESYFFREIWRVILCRTLICFQTKIPLRLFMRIRRSTRTHPTILGMTIPCLVFPGNRSTRKTFPFETVFRILTRVLVRLRSVYQPLILPRILIRILLCYFVLFSKVDTFTTYCRCILFLTMSLIRIPELYTRYSC